MGRGDVERRMVVRAGEGEVETTEEANAPSADMDKELSKSARKIAGTFAPRSSTAKKNPAYKGSALYTVFEVRPHPPWQRHIGLRRTTYPQPIKTPHLTRSYHMMHESLYASDTNTGTQFPKVSIKKQKTLFKTKHDKNEFVKRGLCREGASVPEPRGGCFALLQPRAPFRRAQHRASYGHVEHLDVHGAFPTRTRVRPQGGGPGGSWELTKDFSFHYVYIIIYFFIRSARAAQS